MAGDTPLVLGTPQRPGSTAPKSYVDAAVGQVITWSGTAWPTLASLSLTSFAGIITWDSSNDVTASVPSEMRSQDNWLQSANTSMARRHLAVIQAVPGGTAFTLMGHATPNPVGTATAATVATTNVHTANPRVEAAVTTASTSAVAGWRDGTALFWVNKGFQAVFRFGPSRGQASNSTRRFFVGFTSSTAAPTDVDPSGISDCLGVGADTADTNWQFMHRTGAGTVVKSSTGFSKSDTDTTNLYELTITVLPGGTTAFMTFKRFSDGSIVSYTTTTAIPAGTTLLAGRLWTSVGGTSAVVGLSLVEQYIETDV